ncbi:hypothetical protein BGP_0287 [Beggiatoa sp. PS]|nr:hypothetical protein BGP_0287 [Beggiatoa sp. PS]
MQQTTKKTINLGNNRSINIGYPPKGNGFYTLIENTDHQWTITKISQSSLRRTKDSQEVLFIKRDFNYVSPAFIPEKKEVDRGGASFNCFVVMDKLVGKKDKGYSPCAKTKLVKIIASPPTVISGVLTILSAGTLSPMAMINKAVDRNIVSKVIRDTDLIAVAKFFDALLKKQAQYRQQLEKLHTDIINTANWDIDMKDKSGFYTTGAINFSSLVTSKFEIPKWLHPKYFQFIVKGVTGNIKMAIEQRSNELDDFFATERPHYQVSLDCPNNLKHNRFSLHFSKCPKFINTSSASQPVSIKVVVKSKDFFNVYPTFFGKDRNIKVEFDGSNIRITNGINKYVNVLSISLYYNNIVETTSDEIPNKLIGAIPPQSYTIESFSTFFTFTFCY